MLYKIFIPVHDWAAGVHPLIVEYQGNNIFGNKAQLGPIQRGMSKHYYMEIEKVKIGENLPGGLIYVNSTITGKIVCVNPEKAQFLAYRGIWLFTSQKFTPTKGIPW